MKGLIIWYHDRKYIVRKGRNVKKISIIVPCYNVESYIDRCVNSLVNQTIGVDALELIFVDDASTDHTYEKLCAWEKKYLDSILVIHCETNSRQGGARNIGLSYASADYIGFVDSDDWVDLSMYEKLYSRMQEIGADVVGSLFQRENSNGKIIYQAAADATMDQLVEREPYGDGGLGMPGGIWCKLYRRDMIVNHEIYFPEGLSYEDNYWNTLLSYYVKSYYVIPEVLYHYLVNEASTVVKRNSDRHLDRLQVELLKLEELKRRGCYDRNQAWIEFGFLRYFYINSLHLFFTRFDTCPYDTICWMQRKVCELVPGFEENPYLDRLNWIEQFFLKTAKMKLTQKEFEEIAAGYRADVGLSETV